MLSTDERGTPTMAERGRAGARSRWGPQRILRLDELTPPQRRLVTALLEAVRDEPDEKGSDAA